MSTLDYDDPNIRAECDKQGYAKVKAVAEHLSECQQSASVGAQLLVMRKWLADEDEKRETARNRQAIRSLKIAMWAAIASALSAFAALVGVIFPLAQARHWFGL